MRDNKLEGYYRTFFQPNIIRIISKLTKLSRYL